MSLLHYYYGCCLIISFAKFVLLVSSLGKKVHKYVSYRRIRSKSTVLKNKLSAKEEITIMKKLAQKFINNANFVFEILSCIV